MPPASMNEDKSLISVVKPAHNHARYVAEAINSILAQTYPCFEFIIVDDISADGSPEIVRAFAAREIKDIKDSFIVDTPPNESRVFRKAKEYANPWEPQPK